MDVSLERPQVQPPPPLPDRPPAEMVTIRPALDWDAQTHPGYGLTARVMVAAFRQAELGWPWQQCDLFDDVIESDGHLRSALESRLKAVSGKPWIILPGGDSAADRTAAQELEGALREVPNFSETLAHQLKGNWYGYSASEIRWEYTNGIIAPTWFANVSHRRIVFDWIDYTPRYRTLFVPEGIPFTPGAWWYWTRAGGGTIPPRSGLMRTASWWSFFKRLAVRDWVVFAERFGLPYVLGTYDAGASQQDKDVLKQAVQKLGTDGAAVMSAMCKIEIHASDHGGKTADVHGSITQLANNEISKLITGATLTAETAGPGSFALGQVHADAAFELRAGDAEDLTAHFERAISAPFLLWNGMKAKRPRLKLNLVRDMAPLTRAQILSILCNNIGLPLDEEQLRQENQLKKPSGPGLVGNKNVAIGTTP